MNGARATANGPLRHRCDGRVARRVVAAAVTVGLTVGFGTPAPALETVPSIVIDPAAPDAHWLAGGTATELPITPRNGLADLPPEHIGWFDFRFTAPATGWRQVNVAGIPHVGAVELDIDPEGGADGFARGSFRPGDWVWLPAGEHRLRVAATKWIGLPQIETIRLDPPWPGQSGAFRLLAEPGDRRVTVTGACRPLRLLAGGFDRPSVIEVMFRSRGRLIQTQTVTVAPSAAPRIHEVAVPCATPGDIEARAAVLGAPPQAHLDATARYTVFATGPVKAELRLGEVALEIDVAARPPDFAGGGTQVTETAAGRYRESSDVGVTPIIRSSSTEVPGWFAYRVTGLTPGRPYLFEVDYPDDADRVMVAAFHDARETAYPTSVAMETGGVWPRSGRLARRSAIVWPQSNDARAILYTMHDGQRAAAAKIRFRTVTIEERPAAPPAADGREVTIWSEEGRNFQALVGTSSSPMALHDSAERYVQLASLAGATTLAPTLAVYNFQLYPSRFNVTFQEGDEDVGRALMLAAQRYGLRVMPELHLRADELLWPVRSEADINRRLLLSSKGRTNRIAPDGSVQRPPLFNALDPDVRAWYRAVVVELAEHYKDVANFAGVQLRVMDWQNPALNNLESLAWGYNAEIVARFFRDTGLAVPKGLTLDGNAPKDVEARHRVLTGPLRERWISWRCEQIAAAVGDIVAAVRAVRPDLKVRLSDFMPSEEDRPFVETTRDAGLDLQRLKQIAGLEIVDARFRHGAKEASPAWQRTVRERYRSAPGLELFAPAGARAATLAPMEYLEITGKVAPSRQLGWPAREDELWVSAASEPPGRAALARYAELVGFHDVYAIGDGGNGYVFSGEGLQDFAAEFRALPRVPFERIEGGSDKAILRRSGAYFYAVSLSDRPIDVSIALPGLLRVARLTTGETVSVANRFSVHLRPFELIGFRADRSPEQIGYTVE